MSSCKFGGYIECYKCGYLGHKAKYCEYFSSNYQENGQEGCADNTVTQKHANFKDCLKYSDTAKVTCEDRKTTDEILTLNENKDYEASKRLEEHSEEKNKVENKSFFKTKNTCKPKDIFTHISECDIHQKCQKVTRF